MFDTRDARIRLGATCVLARDDRLGFVACEGDGGSVWTFEPNGQIHTNGNDRRCLEGHGADRPVAVVPCAAGDNAPLAQLWRPLDPPD